MSYSLFIDGRFTESHSGRTIDVIDPARQQVIARVPDGDASDVDAAVRPGDPRPR